MTDFEPTIFDRDFPTLLPHHVVQLKASGIADEVIRERGYESVIGSQRLRELKFADYQCRRVGILLPVRCTDGSNGLYQYKPDNPRTEKETGKVFKYETPAGKGLRLDVAPRSRPALVDPSIPLWITEGIKKGDAAASNGLCAITLLGVWGFKGRGELNGIAWLTDWDFVALNDDRLVNVCYDSDVMTNPKVKLALDVITEWLSRKDVRIRHIYLPGGPKGEKVGLDDFLLTHDAEELERYAVTPSLKVEPKTPAVVRKLLGGDDRHFSDMGNGYRLVARHGENLRYCHAWGKWLCWNGKRWEPDARGRVVTWAKDTVKAIYQEARETADPGQAQAVAEWAMTSESMAKIGSMIDAARNELPITPDELDADPWIFNCENGTIDLRNGELYDHRRGDYLTKLSAVVFDPAARCHTWNRFLIQIMAGRRDLVRFLRRAVGYSLTGDVSEQVILFLFGTGANGKSTFLNVMLGILGDYAKQAPPGLLMSKTTETHPTELADLVGIRFVSTVEVEEGKRLAEALLKQVTGGDPIKARRMREDFWTFMPSHKIWLAANHKPVIRGTDEAIWRRIRTVPFEVFLLPEQRDRDLPEKLKQEYSGILAWMVRGCVEWQRSELGIPPAIAAATEKYRREMDLLATFFADCCVVHAGATALKGLLYQNYRTWCEANGEKPITQQKLSRYLTERGFTEVRGTGGPRKWFGLGLATKTDENSDVVTLVTQDYGSSHENPQLQPLERQPLNRETASLNVTTSLLSPESEDDSDAF